MHLEHWVQYALPGSLFNEFDNIKLPERTVEAAIKRCPSMAFAFHFFDVQVTNGTLENGEAIQKRDTINESGKYYPGGKIKTIDEVAAMGDGYSSLLKRMKDNRWEWVVRTRKGTFLVFENTDTIL